MKRTLLSLLFQPTLRLSIYDGASGKISMRHIVPIISFLLVVTFTPCRAQTLEGRVVDQSNGGAIEYAFLSVGRGAAGTITNSEGRYKIELAGVNDSDSLVVSHIRYLTLKISIGDVRRSTGTITLTEHERVLKEVEVKASEDDALLAEIQKQSKSDLRLPLTLRVYYREWVKENQSYNRFSDGILTVTYPENREDMKIKIEQSRAFHLPRDEDEIFEMNSPVKMEMFLGNGYVDFLNRFLGKRKDDYHFYEYDGDTFDDRYSIAVEPRRNLAPDEDKVYYNALIKANANKDIREANLSIDSMTNYVRSALGLTMKVKRGTLAFSFRQSDVRNYLCYGRISFTLEFKYRQKEQTGVYCSEFILLDAKTGLTDIPRKDSYTKNSLYKNGNHYQSEFWREIQMPVLSAEEKNLLADLEQKYTKPDK